MSMTKRKERVFTGNKPEIKIDGKSIGIVTGLDFNITREEFENFPPLEGEFELKKEEKSALINGTIGFEWFPRASVVFEGIVIELKGINRLDLLDENPDCIIDGVEKSGHILRGAVFDGDLRVLPKGHREITIEAARWVDVDRKGQHVDPGVETVAEKISDRRLHAGRLLAVPVQAQDEVPIALRIDRNPDVLNAARPVHIHKRGRLTGRDRNAGTHLPCPAEIAGAWVRPIPLLPDLPDLRLRCGRYLSHPPFSLLAIHVFRRNGARLCVRELRDVAQSHVQTVE